MHTTTELTQHQEWLDTALRIPAGHGFIISPPAWMQPAPIPAIKSGFWQPPKCEGIFVGACVGNGARLSGQAHAHSDPRDEYNHWICVAKAESLYDLTLMRHEFAHVQVWERGSHGPQWRYALKQLGEPEEADKYNRTLRQARADVTVNGIRVGDMVRIKSTAHPTKYRGVVMEVKKLTPSRATLEWPGYPLGQYRYPNYWPIDMLERVQ